MIHLPLFGVPGSAYSFQDFKKMKLDPTLKLMQIRIRNTGGNNADLNSNILNVLKIEK